MGMLESAEFTKEAIPWKSLGLGALFGPAGMYYGLKKETGGFSRGKKKEKKDSEKKAATDATENSSESKMHPMLKRMLAGAGIGSGIGLGMGLVGKSVMRDMDLPDVARFVAAGGLGGTGVGAIIHGLRSGDDEKKASAFDQGYFDALSKLGCDKISAEKEKEKKRRGYGKAMGIGAATGGGISTLLAGDPIGGPLLGAGIGALANRRRELAERKAEK